MIAKIGRSSNLYGALSYNNLKIEKEKGVILRTNKIIETADCKYSVSQLVKSFDNYLIANRNTEKHTLHISLNPDPKDNVSDEQYQKIAEQYMIEMGYGNQPFVVFKHTDIDRSHIHIVSVCVDEDGKKISDKFEKMRSMKVCRELEKRFGLISALEKERHQNDKIFSPVHYPAGDVKSQIAAVVRHLPDYYKFQTLGEFNALLSLFNITTEKVEGELHGRSHKGLLYFPLDENGKKVGSPFKASLFGRKAGIHEIEKHLDSCKITMKNHFQTESLKKDIESSLESTPNEKIFREQLAKLGIDTVTRTNNGGRIYGITFIDHQSKTVWNGSRLGKKFSANEFNDKWNNQSDKKQNLQIKSDLTFSKFIDDDLNDLSDFNGNNLFYLIDSFDGILPVFQGEDYEEIDFANMMKKKRKRRKGN